MFQFTDDTSMALCLANSLVARRGFVPYDQLVRYKWWYNYGYMSSTGQCFDIGAATRQSIVEFEHRQKQRAKEFGIKLKDMDYLSDPELLEKFNVYCSEVEVAGNGALMRLAPVPLFFYRSPAAAVEFSGRSGQITHGDQKAYDACRYYGALIVAALRGETKDEILDKGFYLKHKPWFGEKELHSDINSIAEGSYQKWNGYDGGIRGKGYIVSALEAALWAFWSDEGSFEKGALAAVNLGDDTDTTAAIYGQLAGAYYGYQKLPAHWLNYVYAKTFMLKLSKWIAYEGECWQKRCEESIANV
jgi:ADP-ribosylglycohydrolase